MMKYVAILLFVVAVSVFAQDDTTRAPSQCEEDRAKRLNAVTPGPLHLVPECETNGDYKAKQCFTDPKWCICYRRNGENINSASPKITACECVRARDDELQATGSSNIECLPSGEYKN